MNFDMELISRLFEQLLIAILPVVAVFFVRLLIDRANQARSEVTNEQRYMIDFAASMAVKAAEQLFGGEAGKAKKDFALRAAQDYLAQHGLSINIASLDNIIEAAVFEEFNRFDLASVN